MLSETWLHNDIQDSLVAHCNYISIRKDGSSRGGVASLAITDYIESPILGIVVNRKSVWARFNLPVAWLTLGVVHRRSGSTLYDVQEVKPLRWYMLIPVAKLLYVGTSIYQISIG